MDLPLLLTRDNASKHRRAGQVPGSLRRQSVHAYGQSHGQVCGRAEMDVVFASDLLRLHSDHGVRDWLVGDTVDGGEADGNLEVGEGVGGCASVQNLSYTRRHFPRARPAIQNQLAEHDLSDPPWDVEDDVEGADARRAIRVRVATNLDQWRLFLHRCLHTLEHPFEVHFVAPEARAGSRRCAVLNVDDVGRVQPTTDEGGSGRKHKVRWPLRLQRCVQHCQHPRDLLLWAPHKRDACCCVVSVAVVFDAPHVLAARCLKHRERSAF
mmetsp:Transcript_26094/g.60208  ORF Transcript_26094/g.60208 Transcript_26094/m.60208 type:complete len:267 (-) Transcript_26094:1519-2319(-)